MRNNRKQNSYYFKVQGEHGKEYYPEFMADTYERAYRNAMFCLFQPVDEVSHKLRDRFDTPDEIFNYLDNKYKHLISESNEEECRRFDTD